MNFVDSLNEYYNLKSEYDEQFVKEKKKIRDMIGNNNEKVKRWKIAIQQYDITIEYIKGPDNIIADGVSTGAYKQSCTRNSRTA